MGLARWKNRTSLPSIFNNELNGFFNDDFWGQEKWLTHPSVNILEDENGFTVELAAPGLDKGDFNLDLDHNILTITAEKKTENEENEKGYTRREFNYSKFKRTFTLPESVDKGAIEGTYENGILSVTLPVRAEAKKVKKTIEVS